VVAERDEAEVKQTMHQEGTTAKCMQAEGAGTPRGTKQTANKDNIQVLIRNDLKNKLQST
jgi:hypothetical protein